MGKWENSAMISLCSAPGARLVAPDSLQHGMRIGIGEFLNEAAPSGAPGNLGSGSFIPRPGMKAVDL